MLNSLRQRIANLINPAKNSMTLPQQFMRYGGKTMAPDWTQVVMRDEDLYTGYSYAAIRNRSNAVASLSKDSIKTDSETDDFVHPYLEALDLSPTFSNYQFWYDVSTYLDLEGVYYLMVIRANDGVRFGKIKEFKLLNPYEIQRLINNETMEVEAYRETRGSLIRDIPTSMIIEIRELNPFDRTRPFSMTDAAKETQFTLKTAGDYTRHSLKHNINAPGIISTDVYLDPKIFANFKARITEHTKGEPVFGNGQGAITWTDMNVDLSKSALKDVNEMNREMLFSIAGVSKTIMGIEQSGTTRETGKVQKDLLIEQQTLPRIQLIIDALNQDYKNKYPTDYASNKALIVVDNPSKTDHDADLKATEADTKKYELYKTLVDRGVPWQTAAMYAEGEINLDMIPLTPVVVETPEDKEDKEETEDADAENSVQTSNSVDLIQQQQGVLKNAIVNIDQKIVASCITRIENTQIKNQFEEELEVMTKRDKASYINDLELVLAGFYGIVITLQGGQTMRDRTGEFSMPGHFAMDRSIKNYIKDISKKGADSHVHTVLNDVLKTAHDAALEGKSLSQVVEAIRREYSDVISTTRAETIARTETNRAFTRAQFDADRQFIKQNKLNKRAYKKWRTRSANPCSFCESLAQEPAIPFNMAFADVGDILKGADGKTMEVTYETLEAGNAHPNCFCTYDLIIREE